MYIKLLRLILFVIFICIYVMQVSAQIISLHPLKKMYIVGDTITVKVVIGKDDKKLKFRMDIPQMASTHLEILNKESTPSEIKNGLRNFVISCYDSGLFYLPPIRVTRYVDSDTLHPSDVSYTDSVPLYFSTMEVDRNKDIKPIKDIISEGTEWVDYLPWIVGISLLLIIGLVMYFVLKRKSKEVEKITVAEEQIPLLSPVDEALKSYEELAGKSFTGDDALKKYYTEMTDIMRHYLERQFGVDAFEKTSLEMISALKKKSVTETDLLATLEQKFTIADLVKFAKHNPNENETAGILTCFIEFVKKSS